jgi:hypothetical protein
MALIGVDLGIQTYAGYTTLVGGWGNEALLEHPPKLQTMVPAFKAGGKSLTTIDGLPSAYPYDSGTMCTELLRLAHLGLPAKDNFRQHLLWMHRHCS